MTPELRLRRYRELAIRMLLAGLVLSIVQRHERRFAILLVMVVLAVDAHHPFSLKNFYLVYAALLFGVGDAVMHLPEVSVMTDAIAFVGAFLVGYGLSSIQRGKLGAVHHKSALRSSGLPRVGRVRISSIERSMVCLAVLSLLLLALQFRRYGIVGYYQGQQLADQFITYGVASAAGGAEQIVRFGLTYSAIAFVILYCQSCLLASRSIQYRYPVGLLIVIPILFLHRFDAVIGAATALAIYACERRVHSLMPSSVASGRASGHLRRARRQGRVVAVAMVVTFAAAIIIGGLRNGVGPAGRSAPSVSTSGLLTEEFTPIQAYSDIKVYSDLLGHPLGKTIILPLVLKVIPRAWFPNKPLNSGGYYMSVVHPATFAAGFALPPTFFGDALLSFGFVGALLVCLILGGVCARLDTGYKDVAASRIPLFLIAFSNFYGVMRFPLSESLAGILLTLIVWRVGGRFFTLKASGLPEPSPVAVG